MEYALKAFEIILTVAKTVKEAQELWSTQRDIIKTMQDEGRDPSAEEWSNLFALVQENSDKIQK